MNLHAPKNRQADPTRYIDSFERKIEEYFASCLPPDVAKLLDQSLLREWPLYRFSISNLFESLRPQLSPSIHKELADKLIDIKLHYSYLLTIDRIFYAGAFQIVGNNEIEKLNPMAISWLRGIHYRVYLISVIIEQILDLTWIISKGEVCNSKKDKWGKIIFQIQSDTENPIITEMDKNLIINFKTCYRTAEMHKFSTVRAMTGKESWNHLQQEANMITEILKRIYIKYTNAPPI